MGTVSGPALKDEASVHLTAAEGSASNAEPVIDRPGMAPLTMCFLEPGGWVAIQWLEDI